MNVDNKLIAEFLGYSQPHPDYPDTTYWYKKNFTPLTILSFDTDWNWLMEVVEKIESLGFEVQIYKKTCFIYKLGNTLTIGKDSETKIQAVYNACVVFIKWYNKQPK